MGVGLAVEVVVVGRRVDAALELRRAVLGLVDLVGLLRGHERVTRRCEAREAVEVRATGHVVVETDRLDVEASVRLIVDRLRRAGWLAPEDS